MENCEVKIKNYIKNKKIKKGTMQIAFLEDNYCIIHTGMVLALYFYRKVNYWSPTNQRNGSTFDSGKSINLIHTCTSIAKSLVGKFVRQASAASLTSNGKEPSSLETS